MNKLFSTSAHVLFIGLTLLAISFVFMQACTDKQTSQAEESSPSYLRDQLPTPNIHPDAYNNTRGYWDDGKLITEFDCPDSRFFEPIDIKSWNKIHVVKGRFPTYAETMNGTAISHYGEKANPKVRPYNMILPKLAYHYNRSMKMTDLVVVIQIVQTDEDTVVGFRYLTGGCGGSRYRDFNFLTEEEVKKVVGL